MLDRALGAAVGVGGFQARAIAGLVKHLPAHQVYAQGFIGRSSSAAASGMQHRLQGGDRACRLALRERGSRQPGGVRLQVGWFISSRLVSAAITFGRLGTEPWTAAVPR